MKTEVIRMEIDRLEPDKIRKAAKVLREGGLVAFPTETVYGLGANALDANAVKGIFTAKGRPSDNPLIVHIADKPGINTLISDLPLHAEKLMENFWPGPLTLVFEKSPVVPAVITAGLNTVAVRMPLHPVARALIREAGVPVAAPSANTSGRPSPTVAKHVIDDLYGKVDIIFDAGSASVGLESTVLDVTRTPCTILRPGGITREQLEAVLGEVDMDPALASRSLGDLAPRSPGMKYTHYAPKAEVVVVEGEFSNVVDKINELLYAYQGKNVKVGILATEQSKNRYDNVKVICMGDRDKPETIAAGLFGALREFDEQSVEVILAEAIDHRGIGLAVMNRMVKAAGNRVIQA